MSIGEIIRKYREKSGMSQSDIAEKMGIKTQSYAVYETGSRVPKIEVRLQIANILGIDPLLIADLDLSDIDKKRLIMKLLYDYVPDMSINSKGHLVAVFPEEFDTYGEMLEAYKKGTSEVASSDQNRANEVASVAQGELKYWMDTWPRYDYLQYAKEKGIDPNTGGNYSIKNTMLKELASVVAKDRETEKKIDEMISYAFGEGIPKDVLVKRLQDKFHLSEETAKDKIVMYEKL